MKYYEVGFDAGVCYSCNIIQGETEAACRYAAEQHAKRYGYTVGYFNEIDAAALEYNRKPVWSADEYPQPTEPEQPEQEPETAEETTTEQEENEMKNAQFIAALTAQLEAVKNRSAWDHGVQQYAESLADDLEEYLNGGCITIDNLRTWDSAQSAMLNGADGWTSYSYGGSALIYDYEIAERLCNPSELKKTRGGERNPNSRETWLDCQARALRQASRRVYAAIRQAFETIEEVH